MGGGVWIDRTYNRARKRRPRSHTISGWQRIRNALFLVQRRHASLCIENPHAACIICKTPSITVHGQRNTPRGERVQPIRRGYTSLPILRTCTYIFHVFHFLFCSVVPRGIQERGIWKSKRYRGDSSYTPNERQISTRSVLNLPCTKVSFPRKGRNLHPLLLAYRIFASIRNTVDFDRNDFPNGGRRMRAERRNVRHADSGALITHCSPERSLLP